MNILAIETSCDDTCIAIINQEKNILADFCNSQNELHAHYGGIHPSLAKREHEKNIFPLFFQALKKADLLKKAKQKNKIKKETFQYLERYPELSKELIPFLEDYEKPELEKIAVTIGPGLEPCLWVGINFAKAIGINWKLPILKVNHIEAHILVNFIEEIKNDLFPALCLIISGGNTKLFLMQKIGVYKELGETRDDACGECFDKTARILGLPYPGGVEISKRAQKGDIKLPRPMLHSKDYDFSFSGLKTAVFYDIKDKKLNKQAINAYCFEIQEAITDIIEKKLEKAILEFNPKSIIIGGGVSANLKINERINLLAKKYNLTFLSPKYHTDNAVMIGISSLLLPKKGNYDKIIARNNLELNE